MSYILLLFCTALNLAGGACGSCPPAGRLAGRCVSCSQTRVRRGPNAAHAAAGADEQRSRGEAHKSQKQRIFDQVLTLFVLDEVVQKRFHDGSLLGCGCVIVRSLVWDFVIFRSRSFSSFVAREIVAPPASRSPVARNTIATPSS